VLEAVKESVKESAAPDVQLERWVRAYMKFYADNHVLARVINQEHYALNPEHAQDITSIRRELDFEIRFLIESGIRQGVFRVPNPHLTGTAILSLGLDLARWFQPNRTRTADDVSDHYAMLSLRMVGVDRADQWRPDAGTAPKP
jgi:hypothetical protein